MRFSFRSLFLLFPIFLFTGPFVYLVFTLGVMRWPDSGELVWALENSFQQAFLSAGLAIFFGGMIAMGLNRLELHSLKLTRLLAALLLLPSLLPPFFVLLTFLSWVQPFPFGTLGIVLIQFPMMAGFAGVLLQRQMNEKLGELAQMAQVLGASRWQFWWASRGLFRRELLSTFSFMAIWAFTNFSIPFVVGGGRGTTLEILIYEKVRISGDWRSALGLCFIQSVLVGLFLAVVPSTQNRLARSSSADLLRSRWGLGIAVLFALLFTLPWMLLSWSGWGSVLSNSTLAGEVFRATLSSLQVGVWTAAFSLLTLLLLAYGFGKRWFLGFFQIYFPPSVSLFGLVGLGLSSFWIEISPDLFLFHSGRILEMLTYSGFLVLLFVPALFRMGLDTRLSDLDQIIQVARCLGAGDWQIFRELVLPQVWPRICFLSGIAVLWAVGDFALAKFFFDSGSTLPLLIENLMASYRIDAALSLGHLVFLVGAVFAFLFWRLADVFDT